MAQHSLRRSEKEIDDLKSLIGELLRLGTARIFRMQRVVKNLKSGNDTTFEKIRSDYDLALVAWNDRFTSLGVGLRLHADYRYTDRLDLIQHQFVEVADYIDEAVKQREARAIRPGNVTQLEQRLNRLSGAMFDFGKDLERFLIARRKDAYDGKWFVFSPETLGLFPTWYLLKALFKPTYPADAISSSAPNLQQPTIRRVQGAGID